MVVDARRRLLGWPAIVAFALGLAATSQAQEARFGPMREDRGTESRSYDLQKTWLDLKLDERAETAEGVVTHLLTPLVSGLRQIWFDVGELQVRGVLFDDEQTTFRVEEQRLIVDLPGDWELGQSRQVSIEYLAESPPRGLHFVHPDADDPQLGHEIWSQGQSENNRFWIPTWDYPTDRATFEGLFTVRDGLTVVSNGALVQKFAAEEGWTTWHYRLDFPFPAYLISVCVGDYERYADRWRGIPVEYFVQRGVGEEKARRSFGMTPDILEFFSEYTGVAYPYPKYSQVAVQRFVVGGMENISATTQTDRTLHDEREHLDRSSRGLVAHKAAHQWFGDYVTCRTWRHLWLNEGFATYMEALYDRSVDGDDEYQFNMLGNQRAAINRDRPDNIRPLVESFFNRADQGGGSNHVYVKGASVLYMIHQLLGEEPFRRVLQHFLSRHAGQLVETRDLERAIEEVTGEDLHWLFEEYVYLGGHPDFEVEKDYDPVARELALRVKQVQDTGGMVPVFRVPVNVEITCEEGTTTETVWVTKAEEEFRFAVLGEPRMVRFDKGSVLLKTLKFDKPDREWAYQALYDSDPIGRHQAVQALADAEDHLLARETLENVLGSSDHPTIRTAAASSLARHGGERAVAALRQGLHDRESRVRRECARQLGALAPQLGEAAAQVAQSLVEVLRDDLSYRVQEAAATSLGAVGGAQALAALQAASWYDSPNHQVAAAAQRARLKLEDASTVEEVFGLLKAQEDPRARRLGVTLVGSVPDSLLGERRTAAVTHLMQLAEQGSDQLQRTAISSLGQMKAGEAVELLERLQQQAEGRWLRFTIRRSLRSIRGADDAGEEDPVQAMRQSMQSMQEEIQRLRARIEELEGPRSLSATGTGS